MFRFSGCLCYLEASQLIYDTHRLTSFSMMGISTEGHFRAIFKIIISVNTILLLLPVLHLALTFFICMVKLVFSTLNCFNTLACANLVGKSFGRFFVLTSDWRLLTPFFSLYSCFRPFFCWMKRLWFSKMPVNLTQYCRTVFSTVGTLSLSWSIKVCLSHSHNNFLIAVIKTWLATWFYSLLYSIKWRYWT